MKVFFIKITFSITLICLFDSCSLIPRASTIADILPRETDVPGWAIARHYRTGSLSKIGQINALYTEYDPLELIVAEYGRLSDIKKTVRIEIIRFRSALDAFGVYSRERGLNGTSHASGDDTWTTERNLFFRQGRFYIRITGENLDAQETGAIEQFQGVVRKNLTKRAGEDVLPDSLYLFSDDRSTGDIVFYKKGIDTIPGLKNIYVMRRTLGGKKFGIVYAKLPTAFDAEQEFHQILKTGGGVFILSKIGSLQPAIRIISDTEYLFISYYKQWIFGVLNADTMNEGNRIIVYLFSEIKIKITKKDKNG
jgi:hypothetical protein